MYILKHSTRRGSNIFQLFDTLEKPNHFVASRRRWLENQGNMCTARRWAKRVAPAVPWKDSKNAAATTKFDVSQRRRWPLGADGRQAKARYCLREVVMKR